MSYSLECSGAIVIPARKLWPDRLPSFKQFLILGNFKNSFDANRCRESSVSFGFNIVNAYIAFSYGEMEINNIYKCKIYKFVGYGPIQILP